MPTPSSWLAMLARPFLAVATGLVATSLAGCVVRVDSDGYREREEKRFTTQSRPTIQLGTFDGAVVIRGWDRDEVSVEVEKRGADKAAVDTIEVIANQKGDVVSIEVREKGDAPRRSIGFGHFQSRSARLVASVPTGSNLIVRTGDGSIKVEHVNGKVELRSSDGSVTGTDLAGDVFAHTEDGAIRLERLDGKCDAASEDGSIEVQGRLEALRVSTDDGSVVVKALTGSKVDRDWNLSTRDGSMVLYVPDALAADLDAQVDDGTVRLDDAIAFERAGNGKSKNVLRGRLGAGGLRLTMRSGDGNIRLRRLPGDLAALPPRVPMPPPPPPGPPPPPLKDLPVERER
jgi:hypothetical protein